MAETRKAQTGNKYYVYSHTDKDGNVFYVGKGKGNRAWEKSNRHELWKKYLDSIDGEYIITIVERDLDEESALFLENELMIKHGRTVINRISATRHGDWSLISEFWKLRKEDEIANDRAKVIEKHDPEAAIALYREGIGRVRKYLSVLLGYYETEADNASGRTRSILLEYHREGLLNECCLFSLNRLTLCLKRLGRLSEAVDDVERFFGDFPSAKCMKTGLAITKRITQISREVHNT